jgi:hypothetical protein
MIHDKVHSALVLLSTISDFDLQVFVITSLAPNVTTTAITEDIGTNVTTITTTTAIREDIGTNVITTATTRDMGTTEVSVATTPEEVVNTTPSPFATAASIDVEPLPPSNTTASMTVEISSTTTTVAAVVCLVLGFPTCCGVAVCTRKKRQVGFV